RDVAVVTIALGGVTMSPLVCDRHGEAIAAGERPGVSSRLLDGDQVPWFKDSKFRPLWDFDPTARDKLEWDALGSPTGLFEPVPQAIVHAGDSRWQSMQPQNAPPA